MATPSGAPPPYESLQSAPSEQSASQQPPPPTHKTRNGIPPQSRRSMEDEHRPLPPNWARQYDRQSHHQFFVNTATDPPHSIWHHPYDDSDYLASLSPSERSRIQREGLTLQREPSRADIEVESSEDDTNDFDDGLGNPRGDLHGPTGTTPASGTGTGPTENEEHIGATHRLGRKMKDKLTHSTHLQRAEKRRQRAEAERKAYVQHQRFRAAMSRAEETGEPQFLGNDKDGKEVYIEPSYGSGGGGGGGYGDGYGNGGGGFGYGDGFGYGGGRLGRGFQDGRGQIGGQAGNMYGKNGYGVNPYTQGVYANPNARFVRPQAQYYRPYGYGYGGGGYGLPLAAGLGTGLLLGDMLWL